MRSIKMGGYFVTRMQLNVVIKPDIFLTILYYFEIYLIQTVQCTKHLCNHYIHSNRSILKILNGIVSFFLVNL